MIEIKVNNEQEIINLLTGLADAASKTAPLMRTLASTMKSAVDQNFEAGGRPAWLGLKYREGKPLINTGTLRNSIQSHSDSNTAKVGTNLAYAAIHHFGGKTKPHKIKPRYKKALAFGGRVYGSINHPGSNIPARPFMTLTEQDEADLLDDVQRYFRHTIDSLS